MIKLDIDLNELDSYLKDINSNEIPKHVLSAFYGIKQDLGSHPLGIAYFRDKGWYIVDSMGEVFGYISINNS